MVPPVIFASKPEVFLLTLAHPPLSPRQPDRLRYPMLPIRVLRRAFPCLTHSQREHWYLNRTLKIDRKDRDELGPVSDIKGLQGGWYGARNGGFNV